MPIAPDNLFCNLQRILNENIGSKVAENILNPIRYLVTLQKVEDQELATPFFSGSVCLNLGPFLRNFFGDAYNTKFASLNEKNKNHKRAF